MCRYVQTHYTLNCTGKRTNMKAWQHNYNQNEWSTPFDSLLHLFASFHILPFTSFCYLLPSLAWCMVMVPQSYTEVALSYSSAECKSFEGSRCNFAFAIGGWRDANSAHPQNQMDKLILIGFLTVPRRLSEAPHNWEKARRTAVEETLQGRPPSS